MKVSNSIDRLNQLFDSDSKSDTSIAESLGVSKQTISSWRKGRRSPKKSVLIKISELYGVSLEWLMGFDVKKDGSLIQKTIANVDPEINIVSGMMETMTQEQKQQVIDLIRILIKKG